MKKLMKKLLLLAMVMSLASCGNNSSGGSSSSSSPAPITNGDDTSTWNNDNVENDTSQKISSIESLRDKFAKKSLSDGISNNMAVYHVGPTYSDYSSSFNFEFQVSGCINLIFWQAGDCGSSGYSTQDYLQNLVDMGKFKIVKSISNDSIVYEEAIGTTSRDFVVTEKSYDRSSSRYEKMLGLNLTSYGSYGAKSIVSAAYVKLSNGQEIEAYLVEHFDGYNTSRYVVSPAVPVFANPVAVLDSYGYFTGALKSYGNTNVSLIQVNLHTINSYTGEAVSAGYNQLAQ